MMHCRDYKVLSKVNATLTPFQMVKPWGKIKLEGSDDTEMHKGKLRSEVQEGKKSKG